ncbi:MAG: hypothetical protein IEMM0002_0669 [bacterium]|nr:MAG: hypothetical protein IEMM0002_0669 [bacterium]
MLPASPFTIDHIIPRSLGGKLDWLNVVAACGQCNRQKGNRTLESAGIKLLKEPSVPTHLVHVPYHGSMPMGFTETWRKYLARYGVVF